MNLTGRLLKLERVVEPGTPRCGLCGHKIVPDGRRAGSLVIWYDGSWWDTTPRCPCGHMLMANGEPSPSDASHDGMLLIGVSNYALCVGRDGEPDARYPLLPPRRLPVEWWGADGPPPPPTESVLGPIDLRMLALAMEQERGGQGSGV